MGAFFTSSYCHSFLYSSAIEPAILKVYLSTFKGVKTMRRNDVNIISSRQMESVLATNSVLRNTYLLLSLTFLFSAVMAYFSWVTNVGPMNPILLIVGMYGLMFLTQALRNSAWGLLAIFAFTGFLGFTLGPILSFYTHAFSNGHQLIMTALGATGIIFFGLSGYALVSRKDFN